jgi:uncharacterized protein DUF3108
MSCLYLRGSLLRTGIPSAICIILFGFVLPPVVSSEEQQPGAQPSPQIKAIQPGEALTYEATWSGTMKMGTAVMEVKSERLSDGREVLRLVSTSHTEGAVGKLYPLGDVVESVFDPATMQTLSFNLKETQGKKQRRRNMEFDHEHKTVAVRKNEDAPKTYPIPDQVQDNLSSIYFLRTRDDFTVGKSIKFETFDGEQSVLIEVQVLSREKVKTPAGEFDTIKVKAFKGFLMSEGEITMWLTDDVRKIPVLIKGKIKIGSIVFNLTDFKPRGNP